MAEYDYQRGLRGAPCINHDGQHYEDWSAGNREYERQQKEIEYQDELNYQDSLSPEDRIKRQEKIRREHQAEADYNRKLWEKYWNEEKEKAYKNASFKFLDFFLVLFGAVLFFIGGSIVAAILNFLFEIGDFVKIILVYILPAMVFVFGIWQNAHINKKELISVAQKYGPRTVTQVKQHIEKPIELTKRKSTKPVVVDVKPIRVKVGRNSDLATATAEAIEKHRKKQEKNK